MKIADFGWASVMQNKSQTVTVAGTYQYLAPEIIEQKGYTTPVDVWMLGIIFYEMINGKTPFEPKRLARGEDFLKPLIKNIRYSKPQFTSDFNTKSKQLITKLLEKNPKKRIKIGEITKDPLFSKYDLKIFDVFAQENISKELLNPKTTKEWYVSIRNARADILMSMTNVDEKKSIFNNKGFQFGQKKKEEKKKNIFENSQDNFKKKNNNKIKKQVHNIINDNSLSNEEKTKLLLSQDMFEIEQNNNLEEIREEYKVKPNYVRETIRLNEPLDNAILEFFDDHSEYTINKNGNIIFNKLQNEFDNEKKKNKDLEILNKEFSEREENNKKQMNVLNIRISGLEKELNLQKEKHSKELQEKMINLENNIQKLKDENLEIKMGKFKLDTIIYSELKENIYNKNIEMIQNLEETNKNFMKKIKEFSDLKNLIEELNTTHKFDLLTIKKRNEEDINKQKLIDSKTEEIDRLNNMVQKQNIMIQNLSEKLKGQSLLSQFDKFGANDFV